MHVPPAKLHNASNKIVIPPAAFALVAALLFGASTPAAKILLGYLSPQLMAGLLYLGSGIGLTIYRLASNHFRSSRLTASLKRTDLPWLMGVIIFGGIAGPLLLMIGLNGTSGSAASLLLNLEVVFTALLAWFAFKEHTDRRIVLGMIAIVCGSFVLSWCPGQALLFSTSSIAIIAACFCWALDNNFTRNISDSDSVQIAAIKGLVAGSVNCAIALLNANSIPAVSVVMAAAAIGLFGYGLSLTLFIKALRHLGTARTGAYFSTAPFAGAVLSLIVLHDSLTINLGIAAVLMGIGVYLHLTEIHEHEHTHEAVEHEHIHIHDKNHRHDHNPDMPLEEPHSHLHKHTAITHSHPHYPDSEHRHKH